MQVNKNVSSLDHFRSQTHAQRTRRHRAMRCIIGTICILAVGALTAGGAIVVREYLISRAYESASCRVVNVTYDQDAKCSFCEGSVEKGGDKSTAHSCATVFYPCARIVVDFVVIGGRRVGQGVLFDDTMHASSDDAKVRKGANTSRVKHAIKLKTSPARLAQRLQNCCSPH